MIPADYTCSKCSVHGVALWRQYQTFADQIELLCVACAIKDQGEKYKPDEGDQIGWLVPAIPTLTGTWWGYTSVPPEGCAWWKALPLKLEGSWLVKGGLERWITHREWALSMRTAVPLDLRRVDGDRALVFVPQSPTMAKVAP